MGGRATSLFGALHKFGLLLLLGACTETHGSDDPAILSVEQAKLVRQIEATIELPHDAGLLDEYARHYTFDDEGKVVAVYLVPFDPPPIEQGCSVALEHFGSRPCTEEEVDEMRLRDQELAADEGIAGTSLWRASVNDLPVVLDGGCSVVSIVYDPKSDEFEYVTCNGSA